jgi:hypothetical protein
MEERWTGNMLVGIVLIVVLLCFPNYSHYKTMNGELAVQQGESVSTTDMVFKVEYKAPISTWFKKPSKVKITAFSTNGIHFKPCNVSCEYDDDWSQIYNKRIYKADAWNFPLHSTIKNYYLIQL